MKVLQKEPQLLVNNLFPECVVRRRHVSKLPELCRITRRIYKDLQGLKHIEYDRVIVHSRDVLDEKQGNIRVANVFILDPGAGELEEQEDVKHNVKDLGRLSGNILRREYFDVVQNVETCPHKIVCGHRDDVLEFLICHKAHVLAKHRELLRTRSLPRHVRGLDNGS
jgi:hypothetical protein